jgi:hypothetical protein
MTKQIQRNKIQYHYIRQDHAAETPQKKLVKLKVLFYGCVVHKQSYDSSWSSVNKMFIKVPVTGIALLFIYMA